MRSQPVSKLKVAAMWLVIVTLMIAIGIFVFTRVYSFSYSAVSGSAPVDDRPENWLLHGIFYFVAGGFFLVMGLVGYFVVVSTACFTSDYQRPVWNDIKTRLYLMNIFVPVAVGLGIGFVLSAFVSPVLAGFGMSTTMANMAPLIAILVGLQLLQLWVLVWAPVEKRLITKRLATMGITPAHLAGATLIGTSNPASGFTKRMGAIEEDMGALWVTPDKLMFRCDVEQFDLGREQIAGIERKADAKSTTMLAGMAHVIIHVRQPDHSIRQIRLHMEGLWTMGQKKRAMDALAESISHWYEPAGLVDSTSH